MHIKGIYAGQTGLKQLLAFLLLILAGAIGSSLITASILKVAAIAIPNPLLNPEILRIIQFITASATFLMPALLIAILCSYNYTKYLHIKKIKNYSALFWVLISMFLLSPVINLAGLLNKALTLPEFMAPIENWMRSSEQAAEKLTTLLLAGKGLNSLLQNIIVIAITAAITEEFFFRGAMQRITERWTKNPHIVIWIVAFLFSAFHLQFYGFLPRLLLGAYFGYLLLWSKTIWIPVFAHFINNGFAVICMSSEKLSNNEYLTGDIPDNYLIHYTIGAAICLYLFMLCTKRLKILFS